MTFPKHSVKKERGKGRIMVVDDDEGAARVVTWILSQNQYSTGSFQEPRKALEDFKRNPKRYKAIVVSARMPGMTGFEFARRIRKLCAEIRIILLTDFEISKSEFRKVFPSSQIDEIVPKPTAAQQLMQAVQGTTRVGNYRLSNEVHDKAENLTKQLAGK